MKTVAITHIGNVRKANEDSVLIMCEKPPYYLIVADGMGGHAAGEVASRAACTAIEEYITGLKQQKLSKEQIIGAVGYANEVLVRKAEQDSALKGMGTTLTFCHIAGDELMIAQVGDSRAYIYHDGAIRQITNDHTYVQYLVDSGILDKDAEEEYPFKNVITRALGMKELKVDIFELTWQEGDMIVLCSDGLTNYLSDDDIKEILAGGSAIEKKAQEMVDMALLLGGRDNISVVIAKSTGQEGTGAC